MIACTFLMAFRAWLRSRGCLGDGDVRLVEGPLDGKRVSGIVERGRLECEGGEYLHVLGGDPMCLYWIGNPVLVEAGRESSQSTELTRANEWLTSMLAKASPHMASIIESHLRDVGVLTLYRNRGFLEAQMGYIESL